MTRPYEYSSKQMYDAIQVLKQVYDAIHSQFCKA